MPNTQHELLPIVVQENSVLVDARLLHQKLESGAKFTDWIKSRINDYGFEEGKDFFRDFGKSSTKPIHHYLLTLDMAKELSMVERNAIGRSIRRYFIEKEKELRGLVALPAVQGLFKGIKPTSINGHRLYPYRAILVRCGYKANSNGNRRHRYPQHFLLHGSILLITEAFALHLHHQKKVYNNRIRLREMQPVLPMDFAQTTLTPKN